MVHNAAGMSGKDSTKTCALRAFYDFVVKRYLFLILALLDLDTLHFQI